MCIYWHWTVPWYTTNVLKSSYVQNNVYHQDGFLAVHATVSCIELIPTQNTEGFFVVVVFFVFFAKCLLNMNLLVTLTSV